MKVLFLDVDGVLNSLAWFASQPPMGACSVDPKAVKRIRRVRAATGAVIVLSSSWRHVPTLIEYLGAMGLPIYDRTPERRDKPRSVEIMAWLKVHPEVGENYAVIDDDADAGNGIEGHFVRCYPKHGMYGKHEKQLIEILGPASRKDHPEIAIPAMGDETQAPGSPEL